MRYINFLNNISVDGVIDFLDFCMIISSLDAE